MRNLLILVLIALFVLTACTPIGGHPSGEVLETDTGFTYHIVEIEGMPCIWVAETFVSEYAYAGLTCDWSKYNGPQE